MYLRIQVPIIDCIMAQLQSSHLLPILNDPDYIPIAYSSSTVLDTPDQLNDAFLNNAQSETSRVLLSNYYIYCQLQINPDLQTSTGLEATRKPRNKVKATPTSQADCDELRCRQNSDFCRSLQGYLHDRRGITKRL